MQLCGMADGISWFYSWMPLYARPVFLNVIALGYVRHASRHEDPLSDRVTVLTRWMTFLATVNGRDNSQEASTSVVQEPATSAQLTAIRVSD
jgi:hypothetical protein